MQTVKLQETIEKSIEDVQIAITEAILIHKELGNTIQLENHESRLYIININIDSRTVHIKRMRLVIWLTPFSISRQQTKIEFLLQYHHTIKPYFKGFCFVS